MAFLGSPLLLFIDQLIVLLSLVVILESYSSRDSGFSFTGASQMNLLNIWKVLRYYTLLLGV